MKTLFRGTQRKLGTVLAGGVLMLMSGFAMGGIANSKHDLSSTNTTPGATFNNGTAEICVFCHTPHGASNNVANVPLWNRNASSGTTTYQSYASLGSSSFDAKEATVGSISLACLSCHDGTQAMNSVINSPGSGTTGVAGSSSWNGTNVISATGQMAVSAGGYPNLSTDLSNDHPISMQYGGGRVAAYVAGTTYAANTTIDPDFAGITPRNATSSIWYIETTGTGIDITGGQQKDDISLYTRTDASVTGGAQPFVECGSCHDPHNGGAGTATFLRVLNTGSQVCLTCHLK